MLASAITVISALAISALALPGVLNARETFATWTATDFQEGCSPGGCASSFNISAPEGYVKNAPAFDVVCHPVYIQQGWVDCDAQDKMAAGSYVASMWTGAADREQIKISVEHIWFEGEARYNATGAAEFAAGTAEFQIPVTNMSAVL
ncbi:hypothetical protein M426DRAFT_14522 [Hypoxylon sp. CI-4A]|nr:hypothetical protein M426DRAFT_14522 [Hypoxylon sp. CI-4A]